MGVNIRKYWILIFIYFLKICIDVQGSTNITKEHLEALDIRSIRHYRRASKSQAQLLGAYGYNIIVKFPKLTSCGQLEPFKSVLRWYPPGKKYVTVSGTGDRCVYLGGNKFQLGKFTYKTDLRGEGAAFFRLKGQTNPFVVLYFNVPIANRIGAPILWHSIGSSGPGWLDLRFKTKSVIYNQYLTYWIKYRKVFRNTMNDIVPEEWSGTKVSDHIDYRYDVLTTLPTVACPEWEEKGIYCVMLTDGIRPETGGINRYSDYEIIVYTCRIVPWYGVYLDRERQSKPYRTIVRVWETCDPTYNCPPYLKPMLTPGTVGTAVYHDFPPDWNATASSTGLPEEEFGEPDTIRHNPKKETPKFVKVMRKLWPLFLFIFLFVLLVIIPWFFFYIKKRAMEERMKNWYIGTTPSGLVDYSIALPVYIRIPSGSPRGPAGGRGGGQGRPRGRRSRAHRARSSPR